VLQSIALRTDASPRIGASLLRHFGLEGAAWTQRAISALEGAQLGIALQA
jgi:hypothetical protein